MVGIETTDKRKRFDKILDYLKAIRRRVWGNFDFEFSLSCSADLIGISRRSSWAAQPTTDCSARTLLSCSSRLAAQKMEVNSILDRLTKKYCNMQIQSHSECSALFADSWKWSYSVHNCFFLWGFVTSFSVQYFHVHWELVVMFPEEVIFPFSGVLQLTSESQQIGLRRPMIFSIFNFPLN